MGVGVYVMAFVVSFGASMVEFGASEMGVVVDMFVYGRV